MLFSYTIYIDIGMSVCKCTELSLDTYNVDDVWYVYMYSYVSVWFGDTYIVCIHYAIKKYLCMHIVSVGR